MLILLTFSLFLGRVEKLCPVCLCVPAWLSLGKLGIEALLHNSLTLK